MKFIKTYESFSSLNDEQKIKLQTIVDEITDNSMEKVNGNSEVANPRGKARNPFYDRGSRKLQGLGKPFGSIVPGTVVKEKGVITAEVSHGVEYESGLKKDYKSIITMDEKTLEYSVKKIQSNL
tara:strand:+ start:5876 stop:6247 length:372 start_codon:yes stop_codon:yes gene_type:complete